MAVYEDILVAVRSGIAALALEFEGTPLPVAVRKLPRAEEGIDTLPLICVCPQDRAENVRRLSFEGLVQVKYYVEIVFVAANNLDQVSDLDTYLAWREQIRRAVQSFVPTTAAAYAARAVTQVFDTAVIPMVPLDRGKINQLYDYSGVGVEFYSCEPLGNAA